MLRGVADVFAPIFQYLGRLLERFQIVQVGEVQVGVVALVVPERHAEDDVERARVVLVAAGVPVQRLLVVLAATGLCSCNGGITF